jgi:hypothetical protein
MVIQMRNKKMTFYQARRLTFTLLVMISLIITACTAETPVIPLPSEPPPEVSETLRDTETPPAEPPAPTGTPAIPQVLLLAPPGSDPAQVAQIQPILEELTTQEGYTLEVRSTLTFEELDDDVKMVVSLPPDPGLELLAAEAGNTRFLAIGIPDLEGKANINSIPLQAIQPGQQGFMAGVISALVTPDWRVGVISVSDTAEGIAARTGFINGVVYFCGTCRQIYPPFFDSQNQLIQYPLFVELPSGAADNEWEAAADSLLSRSVDTIYVAPGAGGESLLSYLAQAGVKLVGSNPPIGGLTENWIASVAPDPSFSLYSLMQLALQGQEIPKNTISFQIAHINPELLSPGRQKLAESILDDLLAGFIEAGSIETDLDQP